jgi:hypothetical protein
MSFAQKAIATSTTPIHFVHGKIQGSLQYHWFIMCSTENYKILVSKFGTEPVVLEDYGVIVASGFGIRPTDETKKLLKEKYNFDADSLLP